jgi:hypothetical protein
VLPDATLEEMGWFNDLQRLSASAENAAQLLRALGEFNVLDLLPGIPGPTLVLHCSDDAAVPFEQGRLIASRIPRARFVALESRNHTSCCLAIPPGRVSSARYADFFGKTRGRCLAHSGRALPLAATSDNCSSIAAAVDRPLVMLKKSLALSTTRQE